MDDNMAHCSYEAGILEDPSKPPPDGMWTRTVDPTKAPDTPTDFTIEFAKGIPVKVVTSDKAVTDSVEIFRLLNQIGDKNGVGRIDIVEVLSPRHDELFCVCADLLGRIDLSASRAAAATTPRA